LHCSPQISHIVARILNVEVRKIRNGKADGWINLELRNSGTLGLNKPFMLPSRVPELQIQNSVPDIPDFHILFSFLVASSPPCDLATLA